MVVITKDAQHTHFEVKGLHKVWAFKSQLTIPNNHILRAYQDAGQLHGWWGIRAPGTSIPGFISAGTFYGNDGVIFMDVMNKQHAIIVELQDERYSKLIVEVENPDEALRLINGQ